MPEPWEYIVFDCARAILGNLVIYVNAWADRYGKHLPPTIYNLALNRFLDRYCGTGRTMVIRAEINAITCDPVIL